MTALAAHTIKMRKIVFIAANEYVPWGGSELCWSAVAEKLARRRVEVYVSVKDWGAPVKQIEHLRSVGCHIVHRRPASLADRLSRRLFPRKAYADEHVRRLGKYADLIVISLGSNVDGVPWMKASESNGYKYAVIVQSAAEQWWPSDDFAEALAHYYENSSAAFFVSEANLALCRRQFVTPLRNAKVIRNPYNVRYDAELPWPENAAEGLTLACVGRLDPMQKGQDLLLELLDLSHWRARKLRVTLVGSGANERMLRLMADKLKLTSIDFSGFVNDIGQLWSAHHALVLPSRYEGMPLALVEAMLCGRTCIVTDVGGNRELVRDGINGFLAKAPTVELLDEAMTRAWDNRDRLMEMGRVAATDVRKWVSRDPTEEFIRELTALVDPSE
jgi:glycosyltransferase involved in cell wall biosynthesis